MKLVKRMINRVADLKGGKKRLKRVLRTMTESNFSAWSLRADEPR